MIPLATLQPDLFAGGGDQHLAELQLLRGRLTRFASGLSRVNDFSVAAWAGHAVGVEIGEMSDAAIQALARCILDYRTPTFIDSGAFGVFQRMIRSSTAMNAPPLQVLDFCQILQRYDALTEAISDHNLAEEHYPVPLLVMPDIVGDQAASLDLIRTHRNYVQACAFFSGVARPIIPIQRGDRPVADIYADIVQILGTDAFVTGIPSNAVGLAPEEFVNFLRGSRPRAVHILGAFADSRLTPRLCQIVEAGVAREIEVSTDGNPLRSIIIEKGQGRDGRRAAIRQKLGAAARRRELEFTVNQYGGLGGLQREYACRSDESRRRLVGLLSDFSDLPIARVHHVFGLPPAA